MVRLASVILIVLIGGLAVSPSVAGGSLNDGCTVSSANSSDVNHLSGNEYGVEHTLIIDEESECAKVVLNQLDEQDVSISVLLHVDDKRASRRSTGENPGESWTTTWDFSNQYDVTREDHTISVSTLGSNLETTIHKDFDLTDPDIPADRITDVDLVEGTNEDGERIAKVAIRLENPSPHVHMGEAFVHTEATDDMGGFAFVPEGEEESTTYFELEDDPDSTIEGEIRYSSENINRDEGVRDQVWFRGKVGGDVTIQRQEFEPVKYPSESGAYQYGDPPLVAQYLPSPREIAGGILIGGSLLVLIGHLYWRR